MEKVYNQELQKRLAQYISEKGISQSKMALLIGMSETQLSQYRNSKYGGDIAETERKLEEFFRTTEAAEKSVTYQVEDYVPTSISEDVYRAIQYCQLERGMVILHGDAGIGKTKGAEKFMRENPTNAIYLRATPSSGTLGNIMKLLARSLKVPETRNKLELMLSIRDRLEGTNKIIIIDEAQHLKLAALEELRALSDPNSATGSKGTGICLIGNTEIYNRMVGKQEAQFAQLFSRIKMNRYYSTQKVKKEDIYALFPRLAQKGQRKELEFLHGISQSKWGVRGAVNVYTNSLNSEDTSYSGLYNMARNMGIGVM